MNRFFMIAGEPSGDRLGGALMQGLRNLEPETLFDGVGGPEMKEQGLASRFDMSELSVMGLAEVLPKYRHLKRRIAQMAEAVLADPPAALITIDSPDFCLRVAARVRAVNPGIRTIHYVAPSVWAWRPHRAEKMAGTIDHVLALLPFEPPYMREAGMTCDFVGHPIAAEPVATAAEIARFRAANWITDDQPLLLVLPGSRKSEVERLAPTFGEALRPVLAELPEARVVVPTTANIAEVVESLVEKWPGDPLVLDPRGKRPADAAMEKRAAFRTAEVAIAASGTVSLELASAGTPMVIAYDMNWVSRQIISRMLKIDTVTLVNLVSETRAVPEMLGADCKPAKIADALFNVLNYPEAQTDAMDLTMARLGRGGEPPGQRAAYSVLKALGQA
ncbi:MAG: lipid-A-disaccharide synthase [Pseudomonadota bacterium]